MLAKIKYFIFSSSQNYRDYIPNSTDNSDLKHLVGQRFAKCTTICTLKMQALMRVPKAQTIKRFTRTLPKLKFLMKL